MKKAIFITAIFIGVTVALLLRLYHVTLADEFEWQNIASEIATEKANLVSINDVEFFHGKKSFQIVFGKDENGESVIVWVEESAENPFVLIKKANDGWTKAMVKDQIIQNRQPKKILDVRLGMKEKNPLWEATYIDQEDRFTYYYLDFETGSFLKRYSLTKDSKGDL